jgi:anti-sigma B factor antagonist
MKLRDESHGDLLVVHVCSPRLDASKASQFKDEITSRMGVRHTRLVLDISLVDFIDSTGLGALVTCMKRLGKDRMSIVGVKGAVSRLFALTGMNRVFALYPTVDAALAHNGPDTESDLYPKAMAGWSSCG